MDTIAWRGPRLTVPGPVGVRPDLVPPAGPMPPGVGRRAVARPRAGRRTRGQALVEFTLALPLALLLLLGIMEGGRLVASYVALANVASEGARAGRFTSATDADIRAAVRATAGVLGNLPDSAITISPAFPRVSRGTVTVRVTYEFQAVPLISGIWGGAPLPLSAQTTGQVE